MGRIGTFAACVFAASSLSHCVGATEIMVVLETDVACSAVAANGVTIAVGDGSGEPSGIVADSKDCDAGALGKIALTPSGDVGGPVAIRVVLGVNAHAADCVSPKYSGCIVARRSLRYSPHTELSLPIELDQDCLDDPCGPDSTCVHGACSDAGTICTNNVCGIDAGPIDAGPLDGGACTDTPPTLVSSTTAISTPHIARTAKGYAIAWMSSPGAVEAEIVDANGAILSPAVPIATLSSGAQIEAIAMDPSEQNYFVVYEDAGGISVTKVSTSGTVIGIPTAYPGATGLKGSAFWDASQSVLVTAGVKNAAAILFTYTPAESLAATLSTSTTKAVSVSRYQSTYYATTDEVTQCGVQTCTLTSPTNATCSGNTILNCSAIRAAANASSVVVSYVWNGAAFFEQLGSPSISIGPIDDPAAMIPLVVGSTPYRVVWRAGDAIETDTFPTKGGFADMIGATGYGKAGGTGAGFDAVADDPSRTGYAVVYWSGPPNKILFMHRCK